MNHFQSAVFILQDISPLLCSKNQIWNLESSEGSGLGFIWRFFLKKFEIQVCAPKLPSAATRNERIDSVHGSEIRSQLIPTGQVVGMVRVYFVLRAVPLTLTILNISISILNFMRGRSISPRLYHRCRYS